jgi:hypothetical protein
LFPLIAAHNSQLPFVVYNQVSSNPVFAKGAQPMVNHSFQLDVYTETYRECHTIAKRVIDLLNFQSGYDATSDLCVFSCTYTGQSDGYDDNDKTYRLNLQFKIIINN